MKKYLLIVSVFVGSCISAIAGVNLKNGNFYISYTDHDYLDKNGIEITRTYNSKSTFESIFGFGWGFYYETRLAIVGDGTISALEFGGGNRNLFIADVIDGNMLGQCINQITSAAIKEKDIENNPASIAQFKQLLRNTAEKRLINWQKYAALKLLPKPEFKEKTVWQSSEVGYQTITFQRGNYRRDHFDDGTYEIFDIDGKLLKGYDKYNHLKFQIIYSKTGLIQQIIGADNAPLVFTFNNDGFVTSIKGSKGTSIYTYAGKNLISSNDVEKNYYRHRYDSSYNMVGIDYTDSTSLTIVYNDNTFFVEKIIDRDGSISTYKYPIFYDENGQVDDNHYATQIVRFNKTKGYDSAYYEWLIKNTEDGVRYTAKFLQIKNGKKYEEINNEFGCTKLTRGDTVSYYSFNAKGNIITKEFDDVKQHIYYDGAKGFITHILYIDKRLKDTTTINFTYNAVGDLTKINKKDIWAKLNYNDRGKVTSIQYENGKLNYKYNSKAQIAVVEFEGKGTLQITYNNDGDIDKIIQLKGSASQTWLEQEWHLIKERTTLSRYTDYY